MLHVIRVIVIVLHALETLCRIVKLANQIVLYPILQDDASVQMGSSRLASTLLTVVPVT